ncbi:sulfite exporter TauE/SafE family protein [Yoonia sp. BS5-3]|uniref:Probable membrane transporter protein n=1 Tax=Yoonia phaeophyticola TaxID=3137369 RepID=A0ABZ2V0S9_9RHOB
MNEIMILIAMGAMLLVLGGIAGVLAGLLGVGGGIILVPAFLMVFTLLGFDSPDVMQMCLATSLATIVVTSVRSVLAHDKRGAVDWAVLKTWSIGLGVGAVLGALTVSVLGSALLQAIFAVLAGLVGAYMTFGRSNWRVAQRMPTGVLRAIYSAVTGFLSVLLGIGGGSLGVPLMSLHNVPIHRAVGTAAGFGLIIAVPSVFAFLFADVTGAPPLTFGSVNLIAFGLVVISTMITAPWGAALAHRMDAAPLKRFFGIFLILVALNMLRKVLFG